MKTAATLTAGDTITVDGITRTVIGTRETTALGGRVIVDIDRAFDEGAPFFFAAPDDAFTVGALPTSW